MRTERTNDDRRKQTGGFELVKEMVDVEMKAVKASVANILRKELKD